MKILIVDDDPHIRDVVRFALEQANFDVDEAADGKQGLDLFDPAVHQLIVLDVMMPEMDGTEVCRKIRAEAATPIIFLSSRDDEIDKVLGLELGADDYIAKPFSPRELVARVKAMMRRLELDGGGKAPADDAEIMEHGELKLDRTSFEAFWGDHAIELTKTEFMMVWGMMRYPTKVYSREALMRLAYDDHNVVVSDRTIDSHVRHIRKKFEAIDAAPIETVHGVGYRLAKAVDG